ncbi:MAG TPA: hypothetical protein VF945_10175, partial [Polyangia bacterium]
EQIIRDQFLYPDILEDRGAVDAVDEMRKHIAFRVQDGDTFGLSFDGDNAGALVDRLDDEARARIPSS